MKTFLLLTFALIGALLIATPAQAQNSHGLGRARIFKGSTNINIETEDDYAKAISLVVQFLDSGSYQVKKHISPGRGADLAKLVAYRPIAGDANTTLFLNFLIAGKSKEQPTTRIYITGYYQKAGTKYPEIAVNDPKEEPSATVWAIEQKFAATYPDPLAKVWYDGMEFNQRGKSRVDLVKFLATPDNP
jgi:hypothetical protein